MMKEFFRVCSPVISIHFIVSLYRFLALRPFLCFCFPNGSAHYSLFIILYSMALQVISNFTSAQSYFDFFSKEIDKKDLVSLNIIHNSFIMVNSFLLVMIPFSSRNWRRLK